MHHLTDLDEAFAVLRQGSAIPESAASEVVDQLAHGLQCAHVLATTDPEDEELQIAGLFHDLGHLLVPGDDAGHGVHGRDALAELFGERVARLVELHVPAKRFLVSVDPEYRNVLSPVSTVTLARQGGAMTIEQIEQFRDDPLVDAAVALRRADDRAKTPGLEVPGLDRWYEVAERVAAGAAR